MASDPPADGQAQSRPGGGSGASVRTFLIVDVRGFTRYTQEHGDEAASQLAKLFARIVGEEVGPFEGELLEVRGDEALCVFGSARQALRAAIALQRRFRERKDGQPVLPLGVGIGLDAGEAVPTDGGFRGKALNLAARLCALAAPGQVLATESVVHLAHRVDRIEFVSRRAVRLKGVDEPVRVVEVRSLDELPPVPEVPGPPKRRKRLVFLVAAAAAIAILTLVGVLVLGGNSDASAFNPGTVLLDVETGKEVGFVSPSQLAKPSFPTFFDGHFWVNNFTPNSFVELDPATGEVLAQFEPPSGTTESQTYMPYAIDAGALWIGAGHDLVKMDTELGKEVDRFDLDEIVGKRGTAEGVAIGGGLVWVGRDAGRGQVVAIDPATGKLRYRFDKVLHHVDLAYGGGRVWAADFGGVDVIDPGTKAVTEVSDIFSTANFVTAGGGFGWTTDTAKGVVYKIDPAGQIVATYHTGLGANGGSFSNGVFWVANDDEGTVTGIDSITGEQTMYRFDHPVGLAAAGAGTLLVTVQPGPSIEDRLDALGGNVVRLFSQQGALEDGDAASVWDNAAFQVEFATCAKLLNYPDEEGPAGSHLQPEIAAAMPAVSSDRRTYTFTVRRGFRFSPPSGQPVTAETIRYSIERALSPKLGQFQFGAFWVDDIEGEEAFRRGKAAHISGLRVAGNRLSIELTEPSPDFLQRLALPFFCPVPDGTPTVLGGAIRGRDPYSIPSAGPYYAAQWSNDGYIILKRNPNYPGSRPQSLDAIALREGVDPAVAVERIRNGEADGIVSSGHNGSSPFDALLAPGGQLAAKYGKTPSSDDHYTPAPLPAIAFIALNATHGPFADQALRQAAALAIDRTTLARIGGELPSDQLLPPTFPALQDQELRPVKPSALDRAAALMKGRRPTVVMAIYAHCATCTQSAQAVRAALARIGFHVEIKEYANTYAAADNPRAGIDMLDTGVGLDYPDAASFLGRMFVNREPATPSSWLSPDVRRKVDSLLRLSGPERQSAASQLADRLARDSVPAIAYGYYVQGEFFAPAVGCRTFPPVSYGVDLAALCRRDGT